MSEIVVGLPHTAPPINTYVNPPLLTEADTLQKHLPAQKYHI